MNDSRDYILKTAFSLFITNGYKAVTMHDLENATKLTKGAFYHYFKSKEELFQAVIEKFYLSTHLNCEVENTSSLENFIAFNLKCLKERMLSLKEMTGDKIPDPHFIILILEAKKHFPSLAEKIKDTFQTQITQWEDIIIKARENKEIHIDIDAYVLAESFTSIGLGVIKNLILDQSLENSISKIKQQYEQLYHLLK